MKSRVKNIPIVFVHFGNDEYLNIVLHQAKSSNKNTQIILLGDESNHKLNKLCSYYLYNHFEEGIDELEKNYVHLSSNGYQYEFFCIKRWFIIRNYMKENNIEWVFTADSDVLLYEPVQNYFDENLHQGKCEAAYCIIDQKFDEFFWVASGGIAFVSLNFLDKFCNYINETYKFNIQILSAKMEYHRKAKILGGIADMTFFYLYYYYKDRNILNLVIPIKEKVFNNGINLKNNIYYAELENPLYCYVIFFSKGKPFFINQSHQKIFFQSLHFQGGFKNDILKFYRGYNNVYILKLKWSIFLQNLKRKISSLIK